MITYFNDLSPTSLRLRTYFCRYNSSKSNQIKGCIIMKNLLFYFSSVTLFFTTFLNGQSNLALGKLVTSSSVANTTFPNSNLTDGNFSTIAQTGSAASVPNAEWFKVDLGSDYFIDKIVLGSFLPNNSRSRRFMIVTYPSTLPYLGNNPSSYISGSTSGLYNKFIYTLSDGISSQSTWGQTSANPQIPGNPGQNLGPVFPGGKLEISVGIHRARYVLVLNLQDTNFEFTELQVYPATNFVRRFVNGGFETGSITNEYEQVPESNVSGWSTTDGVNKNSDINLIMKGGSIEMWRSGFTSVPSFEGNYFVELNAYLNGKLEQKPICILPDETFTWSFAHRGRSGTDMIQLIIDDVPVAQFSNTNSQSGTHSASVLPAGNSTNVTVTQAPTTSTGWTKYSGTWTNTSGIGKQISFGFAAVSTGSGNLTTGNFLDDVTIGGLVGLATFDQLNPEGQETIPTANLPKILINGTVNTPTTVTVNIIGGTAIRGTDYTTTPATGPLTITVPIGVYDGTDATALSLSSVLQISNDVLGENAETIIMQLQEPPQPADIRLADANSCQGAIITSTYTITDRVCYKDPVLTGNALDTNVGISNFNRAGSASGNWPMIRKGGYIALESAAQGLVVSRTQKSSISNPIVGMLIYETDDQCLSIYTSNGWRCYNSFSCPD